MMFKQRNLSDDPYELVKKFKEYREKIILAKRSKRILNEELEFTGNQNENEKGAIINAFNQDSNITSKPIVNIENIKSSSNKVELNGSMSFGNKGVMKFKMETDNGLFMETSNLMLDPEIIAVLTRLHAYYESAWRPSYIERLNAN